MQLLDPDGGQFCRKNQGVTESRVLHQTLTVARSHSGRLGSDYRFPLPSSVKVKALAAIELKGSLNTTSIKFPLVASVSFL